MSTIPGSVPRKGIRSLESDESLAAAIEKAKKAGKAAAGGEAAAEDAGFVASAGAESKQPVGAGVVNAARKRALAGGAAVADALLEKMAGAQGVAGDLSGLLEQISTGTFAFAGPGGGADVGAGTDIAASELDALPPDVKKEILDGLRELGFELDSLEDPRAADAISAIKEYAGFPGTPEMDFDFLISMFMAKMQQDRARDGSGSNRRSGAANYAQQRAAGGGSPETMQLRQAAPVDVANWKAGAGDVTPAQLTDIAKSSGHSLSATRAAEVAPHLNAAMAEANINTPERKAAFVAQLMHESGSFKFNEELASGAAYEGRSGLGNTQPGDGKKFKGRGFIQLTGRANYTAAGKALGLDLVNNPELAAKDGNAARVAAWFWNKNGLNGKADAGDFDGITRRINGGTNGAADRNRLHGNALKVLAGNTGLPSTGNLTAVSADGGPQARNISGITPVNQAAGGSTKLGTGSSTLRSAGCMLSAYGMAAQAIADKTDGKDVRGLNTLVKNAGGFSGSSLVGPTAAGAMGMKQTGRETITPRNASARMQSLDASLAAGNPVVLGVDYKAGSRGSGRGTGVDHWITVTGKDPDNPGNYLALDPAGGRAISLSLDANGMLAGTVGSKNYVGREMVTFEAK